MNKIDARRSDIPLPAAVMLLGIVVAALAVGGNAARWEQVGVEVDGFVGRYPWIVAISVGAIFLNAFATHLEYQTVVNGPHLAHGIYSTPS